MKHVVSFLSVLVMMAALVSHSFAATVGSCFDPADYAADTDLNVVSGTLAFDTDALTVSITNDAVIDGTLALDVGSSGSCDALAVTGTLSLVNASLNLNVASPLSDNVPTVLATYGTLVGKFDIGIDDIPLGFYLRYAYEGNRIALVPANFVGTYLEIQ